MSDAVEPPRLRRDSRADTAAPSTASRQPADALPVAAPHPDARSAEPTLEMRTAVADELAAEATGELVFVEPEPEPDPESGPAVAWGPSPTRTHARGLAGVALGLSVVGLAASLFVGWAFPIGIVAIIIAIVALRRPVESRPVAWWAIALATVSVIYSVGWLWWAWYAMGAVS